MPAATAKKMPTSPTRKAVKTPTKAAPSPAKPANATPIKIEKKKEKTEKVKVVRDSFTIPKSEYAQITGMKKRAMDMGLEIKKSELLRAGLALLSSTSDTAFRKALGNVPTLKTGRPGKN